MWWVVSGSPSQAQEMVYFFCILPVWCFPGSTQPKMSNVQGKTSQNVWMFLAQLESSPQRCWGFDYNPFKNRLTRLHCSVAQHTGCYHCRSQVGITSVHGPPDLAALHNSPSCFSIHSGVMSWVAVLVTVSRHLLRAKRMMWWCWWRGPQLPGPHRASMPYFKPSWEFSRFRISLA